MSISTKLLDQVRNLMRRRHYLISTEKSYCSWIIRYVAFHQMHSREDLKDGERKIEQFLTHLAVNRQVAPSIQNQTMNAPVFLFRMGQFFRNALRNISESTKVET